MSWISIWSRSGLIWGAGTAMGVFTALLGGASVDRFGTRRTLVVLCLATGIFGALRGFASDFWSLFFFSFLFGMMQPILPMNFFKLNQAVVRFGTVGSGQRCDVSGIRVWLDARRARERHRAFALVGRLARGADLDGRLRDLARHRVGDPAPANGTRHIPRAPLAAVAGEFALCLAFP